MTLRTFALTRVLGSVILAAAGVFLFPAAVLAARDAPLEGAVQFLERERPIIYGEFAAHCLPRHQQSVAAP